MKKVIFISALAIAAAVSCTKSDIVDTKFNEQISFETYTGRAAQTKATVTDDNNIATEGVGLYGYYLGNAEGWVATSVANLWNNADLTPASDGTWGVAGDPKYWANDVDKYTFLAYSPRTEATSGTYYVSTTTANGENPVINYTVNPDLSQQIDLLYAKKEGTAAELSEGVELKMYHALSRLTVKATATEKTDEAPFTFHVKKVSIKGAFNTSGTLNLHEYAGADWTTKSPATAEYVFYTDNTSVTTDAIADNNKVVNENYAYYAKNESGVYTEGTSATNYLMMIPTSFVGTEDAPVAPAELFVEYTTYYEGQESTPITKKFPVAIDFKAGKAYSIDLAFSKTAEPIKFTVSVEPWAEAVADSDDNNDTEIPAGNPVNGSDWDEVE